MSRVVTTWPKPRQRRGGWCYPWQRWLDGQIWVLHLGTDFICDQGRFVQAAYNAARRRGLKCRTSWNPETQEMHVQALPGPFHG